MGRSPWSSLVGQPWRSAAWSALMFRFEVQSTKARPPVTAVSSRIASAAASMKPGAFGSGTAAGVTIAAWRA